MRVGIVFLAYLLFLVVATTVIGVLAFGEAVAGFLETLARLAP